MKKKLLMLLPCIALLASCGNAESNGPTLPSGGKEATSDEEKVAAYSEIENVATLPTVLENGILQSKGSVSLNASAKQAIEGYVSYDVAVNFSTDYKITYVMPDGDLSMLNFGKVFLEISKFNLDAKANVKFADETREAINENVKISNLKFSVLADSESNKVFLDLSDKSVKPAVVSVAKIVLKYAYSIDLTDENLAIYYDRIIPEHGHVYIDLSQLQLPSYGYNSVPDRADAGSSSSMSGIAQITRYISSAIEYFIVKNNIKFYNYDNGDVGISADINTADINALAQEFGYPGTLIQGNNNASLQAAFLIGDSMVKKADIRISVSYEGYNASLKILEEMSAPETIDIPSAEDYVNAKDLTDFINALVLQAPALR